MITLIIWFLFGYDTGVFKMTCILDVVIFLIALQG